MGSKPWRIPLGELTCGGDRRVPHRHQRGGPDAVDRLDAEALYSTRSPAEYEQVRADRREAYEYLPTDDGHWQRAFEAQRLLARTGRHRAVGIIDLLTAVLAAEHGVRIVHYDADFETAAEVLEFEHRWVLPRGTV